MEQLQTLEQQLEQLTGPEGKLMSTVKYSTEGLVTELLANRHQANSSFDGEAEVLRHFGPGSYGIHELLDRLFVVQQNIDQFILESPAISLNLEAFVYASVASYLLADAYQAVALADDAQEDKEPETLAAEDAAYKAKSFIDKLLQNCISTLSGAAKGK